MSTQMLLNSKMKHQSHQQVHTSNSQIFFHIIQFSLLLNQLFKIVTELFLLNFYEIGDDVSGHISKSISTGLWSPVLSKAGFTGPIGIGVSTGLPNVGFGMSSLSSNICI